MGAPVLTFSGATLIVLCNHSLPTSRCVTAATVGALGVPVREGRYRSNAVERFVNAKG